MRTKTPPPATDEQPQSATTLLRADHKRLTALFEAVEKTHVKARKTKLVAQLCEELRVHMRIEEELFFPAFQLAFRDHTLVPEAVVEHASFRHLIAQVEGVTAGGDTYDARVKVLAEYHKHHIKEEQTDIFPKANKSKHMDLMALGAQMAQRKRALMAR